MMGHQPTIWRHIKLVARSGHRTGKRAEADGNATKAHPDGCRANAPEGGKLHLLRGVDRPHLDGVEFTGELVPIGQGPPA